MDGNELVITALVATGGAKRARTWDVEDQTEMPLRVTVWIDWDRDFNFANNAPVHLEPELESDDDPTFDAASPVAWPPDRTEHDFEGRTWIPFAPNEGQAVHVRVRLSYGLEMSELSPYGGEDFGEVEDSWREFEREEGS